MVQLNLTNITFQAEILHIVEEKNMILNIKDTKYVTVQLNLTYLISIRNTSQYGRMMLIQIFKDAEQLNLTNNLQ